MGRRRREVDLPPNSWVPRMEEVERRRRRREGGRKSVELYVSEKK